MASKEPLLWRWWNIPNIRCNHTIAIHISPNPFETPKNHTMCITENYIAKPTHNLNDQTIAKSLLHTLSRPQASFHLQHTLPTCLLNSFNSCSLEMLTQ